MQNNQNIVPVSGQITRIFVAERLDIHCIVCYNGIIRDREKTGMIEQTQTIRIRTLEDRSNRIIEDWIADWNDDNENWKIITQTEIMIGNLDYQPLKWKCEHCGRWNYLLTFMDPSESIVVCEYCNQDDQL